MRRLREFQLSITAPGSNVLATITAEAPYRLPVQIGRPFFVPCYVTASPGAFPPYLAQTDASLPYPRSVTDQASLQPHLTTFRRQRYTLSVIPIPGTSKKWRHSTRPCGVSQARRRRCFLRRRKPRAAPRPRLPSLRPSPGKATRIHHKNRQRQSGPKSSSTTKGS